MVTLAWAGCSLSSDGEGLYDAAGDGPQAEGGFLVGDEDAPGAAGSSPSPATCFGRTQQAEAIALDIYVMLDTSASMLDVLPFALLGDAPTRKWDAVREAMVAFVSDPATADIGVGLQYFPQTNEDVPFACVENEECGVGGPCTSAVCVTEFSENIPEDGLDELTYLARANTITCASDEDCPGDDEVCRNMLGACVVPGEGAPPITELPLCNFDDECQGLPGTACEEIGACANLVAGQPVLCVESLGCPDGAGDCVVPFPYRCSNQTICDEGEYSSPAVEISSAPDRAGALIDSLRAQQPEGLTPTGPALGGALALARAWADENPGRQVVTVLATDGLPTECSPVDFEDISSLAADANQGSNPVRTFVIGVFGSLDLGADGRQNLDALALAGGSERALVISTAGDVQDEFLRALNEIRDRLVSCDFALDAEATLDLGLVNLRMTEPNGYARDLVNVGEPAACGDDQGWFYVRNAAGTPTQISVCPSTCAAFRTEGVKAELEIGCATRIR